MVLDINPGVDISICISECEFWYTFQNLHESTALYKWRKAPFMKMTKRTAENWSFRCFKTAL